MKLAELIDLESQLLRDEDALREGEGKKLLERDRAVGEDLLRSLSTDADEARQRLDRDVALRRDLALGWLERLRRKVPPLPGSRMERGYRLVGLVLGVLAVVMGAGAASAALAYDGITPVNVFAFMAVFVLLQAVLLAGMILVVVFRRAVGASAVVGWAQAFVVWLSRARWVDRMLRSLPEESTSSVSAFRGRERLYGGVERWLLFTLTQRFGVLFNVAALVTCLFLITFTSLAFSWSTTLEMDASDVRSLLDRIAVPWSWWLADAVPSDETIRQSEWIRQGGEGFLGNPTEGRIKEWAGEWWRFLVAALVFWGLLPRLIAFVIGRWRTAASLSGVQLDHAAFQRLYERLLPVGAGWSGPAPEDVGTVPEAVQKKPSRKRPKKSSPARPAVTGAIAWGRLALQKEAVADVVASRFDVSVAVVAPAGGADLDRDVQAIDALSKAKVDTAVLVVEAGVQPTKEIFGFVRDLRDRLGARTQLVIGLVQAADDGWAGPDDTEREAWTVRIDSEGDPYLRLEGLVTT